MSVGDIMGQILPTRMQLRDATNAPVQILTMPQAVKYVWSQSSRRKRPARQDAPLAGLRNLSQSCAQAGKVTRSKHIKPS